MKNKRRTFILFCALQLTYWACFASFISYFVALMLSTGMSSTQISLIQAIYLMLAFLGSFIWGSFSDKLHTNKKTFMLQILGGMVMGVIIYQFRYVPLNYMKLIFYQNVGGDTQWIGYESMVGCAVQFPFFLAAGKMKRIPAATHDRDTV